ncbi:MAG TPA: hypothetical protein VKD71_10975 [Gemmataceae bacterium]|nr:hypothetical protein [Gemmataceae bacterium]
MSITRRDALAAALGLTAATATADDKPIADKVPPRHEPLYSHLPDAVRKVFEDTFPHHFCIRMVTRGKRQAEVYRGTVFDPRSAGGFHQHVDGEHVASPILYQLEVDADGKIVEETLRPVLDLARLPKAVVAAYEKWNPKGVKGQEFHWRTEVPREKARVYRVRIVVNAIKTYSASFAEDGTILEANPAVVP